jgi:hypothetical protein
MKSSIRLIAIATIGLLMTALSPAYAASFGRTTVGTTPSSGMREDFKRGSKFVLSETGAITSLCAYLDTNGGGSGVQAFRLALYRDQNGVPGERVVTTSDSRLEALQQPANWYCLPVLKLLLDPGSYWIVIHTGDASGVIRYYYDGPANWYGNADEYSDDTSYTFGAGGTGNGTLSVRVDYAPARSAGRTTIGTKVSSPTAAQMMRGSSFVLTEGAQLWKMRAYVDGLGGASGAQPLTIALYDDVNGEPSALVARATAGSVTAGTTARWVSAFVDEGPISLRPGKYWIVLATGAPTGVLRYYMEGTGNWRGHAIPGNDPTPFFGVANPGDGTISANILYTPATVALYTLGQTTPGNVTSNGLRANYIRGSSFSMGSEVPPFEGSVTALWAYMDGNGGASGSQKVRLALYSDESMFTNIYREVVSEEVTIPVGKAPGWVRFAVPRTRIYRSDSIFDSYYILMLSGGTENVARYYASNDNDSWYGRALTYNATPPDMMFAGSSSGSPNAIVLQSGSTTLSVYAEYVKDE